MPAPEKLFPPAPRRRPHGKAAGWDALVAVVLGVALLAGGWADVRAYFLYARKASSVTHLALETGEARIGTDEFYHLGSTILRVGNMGEVEKDDTASYRHALGPVSTLQIWSSQKRAQVNFSLVNDFDDQVITVAFRGQTLEEIHSSHDLVVRSYVLALGPGANDFTIQFERYNGHGIEVGDGETRAIAGTFRELNLYF